jgi:hypothetical protein
MQIILKDFSCFWNRKLSLLKVLFSKMDPAEIRLITVLKREARRLLHSKVLTAPLVLHRTRIGKCAMKIFGINCGIIFFIVIHRFSLVKAAMNAPRLCKSSKGCLTGTGHGAMVFTKCLNFLIFQLPKAEQRKLRNCQIGCLIGHLKKRRRSNTLMGFQRTGGTQNLLKSICASPFIQDLSKKTTFSPIHLAGQYL